MVSLPSTYIASSAGFLEALQEMGIRVDVIYQGSGEAGGEGGSTRQPLSSGKTPGLDLWAARLTALEGRDTSPLEGYGCGTFESAKYTSVLASFLFLC